MTTHSVTDESLNIPQVFIDARMVGEVPHGIARYVCSLAKGFEEVSKRNPLSYEPVFILSPSVSKNTQSQYFSNHAVVSCPFEFLSVGEMIGMGRWLNRQRPALVHATGFESFTGLKRDYVQTLHDLNHRHYGGFFERIYYSWIVRSFASRARALMTVSDFSKKEIREWLPSDTQVEIEVTLNAIDAQWSDPKPSTGVLERLGLKKREFWISLSNRKSHRNLSTLFSAYAHLGHALPLIMPGASQHGDPQGLRAIENLSQQEIVELVSGARALISSSEYEGFGMPPIEALLAATPVILSDIEPHREGLKVIDLPSSRPWIQWVSPKNRDAWQDALEKSASGVAAEVPATIRQALKDRYTNEQLALSVDQIYRQVLRL